jgi:hypothetical protein
MFCNSWAKEVFVNACIFSDITKLRGGNIPQTMKDTYILTANAEFNISRPLVTNSPLNEHLCECISIQPVAGK